MNDNNSDNDSVDINVVPPNRDGATVGSMIPEDLKELAELSHYCVIARWEYRGALLTMYTNAWIEAYLNDRTLPPLPKKHDYLLSDDPDRPEIESSFEFLIWGSHDHSVQALYDSLVPLMEQQLQIEDSLQSLVDSLSRDVAALESMSIDQEETPANSNSDMSSEQLEIQRLEEQLQRRERVRERIMERRARIRDRIEGTQGQIMATQGQLEAKRGQIKDRKGKIIERLERMKKTLRDIKKSHFILRSELQTLAGKGNETAGGGTKVPTDDQGRINFSTPTLTPTQARDIANAEPDPVFRQHLLDKEEIKKHKEKAIDQRNHPDVHIRE